MCETTATAKASRWGGRRSPLNIVSVDPMMKAPRQDVEESGRGPRTAVAKAVASPLGVQPTINSAGVSWDDAAVKLRPLPSATAVSRRRTETMP